MSEKKKERSMIIFDDWAIGSTISGWSILKKTKVKKNVIWQSQWYYSSFASCVDAMIKKQIRMSDYSSVKELADNIEKIRTDVFKALEQSGIDSDI